MISFQPLRNLMRERHITTYFLRNKCGEYNLDSKTIQRLMRDESVSTNTLDALCNIFQCEIVDIVEFTQAQNEDTLNSDKGKNIP